MKSGVATGALALAISILPVSAPAQELHHSLCLFGCPSEMPVTNDLIIREIYVLSSNDITKFADWVAYKITRETIGPGRARTWKADPLLADSETLEPADYKQAHALLDTDRGHQVPLASFSGTPHWPETNYLSNITPQKSALNQGPWRLLEEAARKLAKQAGVNGVYGLAGPLYERQMPSLPRADERHQVPSGYWKILAIQEGFTTTVAAFIFEQETPRHAKYCAYLTTVDEVERRSGLNFFHALRQREQDQLEGRPGTLAVRLGC